MGALPCHIIFGVDRGTDIVDLVRRATGQDCPCQRGLPCPLASLLDGRAWGDRRAD